MRRIFAFVVLALCLVFLSNDALAQTANQTLSLSVVAVQQIAVSGNPGALTLNAVATIGLPNYTPATDASTSYSITQNAGVSRITAELDANMPANTTLQVNLASTLGTTAGTVDISNTAGSAANVVTAIANGADQNQTITYTFSGTTAATPFAGTRVVTLTLVTP